MNGIRKNIILYKNDYIDNFPNAVDPKVNEIRASQKFFIEFIILTHYLEKEKGCIKIIS